jgi:drug/metabolite transporter (DMT)-like permease
MRNVSARVLLVLAVGVLAVSTAAIFIREAHAPALSTAALRLLFASAPALALLPLRARRDLPRIGTPGLRWAVLSGACLAVHFVTWIGSLELTTVASSVVFVTTSPLFVAGLSALRGEPPSARMWRAIGVCLAGGCMIGGADIGRGGAAIWGDLLALAGAFFVACYFEIGRRLRASVALTTYTGLVYPVAALCTLAITVGARQPLTGFNGKTYLMFVLLALVPQLIGHSSLNWALGYLSAPFVAIAVLGEPVLSTIFAAIFLHELPTSLAVAGGVVLLAGVWLALRAESAAAAASPADVPAIIGAPQAE